MNVRDGEFDNLTLTHRGHRPDEFAAKGNAADLRDSDRRRFEAARIRQKRQVDDVAHLETADRLGEFDILDALLPAHFLDVLDFNSVEHGNSDQPASVSIAW